MTFRLEDFVTRFWGASPEGEIVLWSLRTKKTSSYGREDIGQLVRDVEKRKHHEDLYFGLSTQPAGLASNKRGSNATAVMLPGFFADIDFAAAKESEKRYPPNHETALKLINSFKYSPFFVQHSGNGLHVLYAFEAPLVMSTEYKRRKVQVLQRRFAQALAAHFEEAGYEIDSVSDLARVFRVPTTFNHKSGMPKPVTVVAFKPRNRLSVFSLEQELPAVESARAKGSSVGGANHALIQRECGWYGHYTGQGSATANEPNWYATASITAYCANGEQIFHDYSARHPGYKQREATRKFKQALDKAGPRTCDNVRSELGNARFCDICPHRGVITSPIELGVAYDPGPNGPRPLGYTKEGLYALLDPVRKIVILASSQQLLSQQYLLGLAASGFWRGRFPGDQGKTNFMAAGEALIKACRHAGPFNPLRVRGRGIWLEGDKVIVNLGKPVESSEFLYLCFESIKLDDRGPFDAQRLRNHLQLYNWRNSQDGGLLFGWLAMAPICGALRWRPHSFVYGPSQSGKSTIHDIASIVLSPLAISADGQSSEAGIRQTLGPDSLPVILDEFESDQKSSTLRNVLKLARSASSANTQVLKGTPEGKAMSFSLRTAFLFEAINPRGLSVADQSRITMLELVMHNSDSEVARRIAEDEAYFRTTGSGWSSHMIPLAHLVQPAADAIEAHIVGGRRHRQNMSILIGAEFVALNGRVPSDEEARALTDAYAATIERHALEVFRDDAQEALDHLLSFVVEHFPLGHWLACERDQQLKRPNDFADAERIVATYSMRVKADGEAPGFYIANGAPAMEGVFRDTQWSGRAWERALRKLDGAFVPKDPVSFRLLGKKRATGIPLSYLPVAPLPLLPRVPY